MLCNSRRNFLPFLSPRKSASTTMPLSTQASVAICGDNPAKLASPTSTSLKCDGQSFQKASLPQKKIYGISHVIRYLNRIEECIQSSTAPSPALRYQHCYGSDDNRTFFKVVGSVLAKPMLRTLIYGEINDDLRSSEHESSGTELSVVSKKIYFDQRLRESRFQIEGQRMFSFMIDSLRPAAQSLEAYLRDEKVPELLHRIDSIMDKVFQDDMTPIVWDTGTSVLFPRLASGRRYKGKLEVLISDVFPDLSEEYCKASRKATQREVLEFVINNDLVRANEQKLLNESELKEDEKIFEKRRVWAAFKCLDRFYPIREEQSPSVLEKQSPGNGVLSGKRCEETCLNFLRNEYVPVGQYAGEQKITSRGLKILQNVFINARRNTDQPINPKRAEQRWGSSGIIWTDCGRHRLCSEFDALVLSSEVPDTTNGKHGPKDDVFIDSIWESKKTISPSTIHDIVIKKLGAIEALIDDQAAELVYKDGEITETIPFSYNSGLTLGIYGSELQSPENAADCVRAIAAAHVVNSNINEVIRSLERDDTMVEVQLASALDIVQDLKSLIEKIRDRNRVEVILLIEGNVGSLLLE